MKTKIFICCLNVLITFAACNTNEPTETDFKIYVAALCDYYTYSLNEELYYTNENMDRAWVAIAFDYFGDGVCPHTHVFANNDVYAKSYGDKYADIAAYLLEDGLTKNPDMTQIHTTVSYARGSKTVYVTWTICFRLNDTEHYSGVLREECAPKDFDSLMKKTIEIPLKTTGSYALIEKGLGLTAFSLDGTTLYRRQIVHFDNQANN